MSLITVQYAVKKLLRYFTKNEQAIPGNTEFGDSRIEACIDALHEAGAEIRSFGPLWPIESDYGALINAPATLTGAVTKGAKTVEIATGAESWMEGCTVAFTGDVRDNEIETVSGTTVTMRDPVLMTTGNHPLMVWHDCIDVDDAVGEIQLPVMIAGRIELIPVTGSRPATYGAVANQYFEDYGFHNRTENSAGTTSPTLRKSRHTGMPLNYYVEGRLRSGAFVRSIRVSPLPTTEEILNFGSRNNPTRFTVADVTGGSTTLPFPPEFVEVVYLKIAAQQLTECPWFRNNDVKPEIKRGYNKALKILRASHPQSESGVTYKPKY